MLSRGRVTPINSHSKWATGVSVTREQGKWRRHTPFRARGSGTMSKRRPPPTPAPHADPTGTPTSARRAPLGSEPGASELASWATPPRPGPSLLSLRLRVPVCGGDDDVTKLVRSSRGPGLYGAWLGFWPERGLGLVQWRWRWWRWRWWRWW